MQISSTAPFAEVYKTVTSTCNRVIVGSTPTGACGSWWVCIVAQLVERVMYCFGFSPQLAPMVQLVDTAVSKAVATGSVGSIPTWGTSVSLFVYRPRVECCGICLETSIAVKIGIFYAE